MLKPPTALQLAGSAMPRDAAALAADRQRSAEETRWAVQHRGQLEANWVSMGAGRALERIEPLE
jgi:hypothetical protein